MYGYPQPPPQQKSGLPVIVIVVLAILGIMIVGGGILAVLGIYGTRKYIAAAKTAEATNTVGQIQKYAQQAYDRESMDDKLVLGAGTEAIGHKLCASASKPVPTSLSDVAAKKYMSAPGEWLTDEKTNAGFACLKFEMTMPQYYQYDYKATASAYTATARGDLDGDGESSTFEGAGTVDSTTHTVKNALLVVKNPDE